MTRSAFILWSLLIAALVVVAQAITLVPGHEWYADDYAAYIHNARALINGGSYALPGYVANLMVDAGPAAYPVGYPAMLAPVVALFGVDFKAILTYNLVFAGLCVVLFMLWLRPVTGEVVALAAGLLVGFSPFVTGFKPMVQSEFGCTALLFAWLLLDRSAAARPSQRIWPVLAGLALGAMALTRLVMAPAIAAAGLAAVSWHNRRLRLDPHRLLIPSIAVLLLIGGLLAFTPEIVTHYWINVTTNSQAETAGRSTGLSQVLLIIRDNILRLPGQISVVWSYGGIGAQIPLTGVADLERKAATVVLLIAGLAGFIHRLRRGPGAPEWFFLLQLCTLLPLPAMMTAPRLYIMHSLLLIYYAFVGVAALIGGRWSRWAVVAVLVAGSVPSWQHMAASRADPFSVTEPRAQEFLAWVRSATPPDAVLVARRARAVLFFTGRNAVDWHQPAADAGFQAWAQARRADYIVFSIDLLRKSAHFVAETA